MPTTSNTELKVTMMMKKRDMVIVNCRVTPEIKKKFTEVAEANYRSRAGHLHYLIMKEIEDYENDNETRNILPEGE